MIKNTFYVLDSNNNNIWKLTVMHPTSGTGKSKVHLVVEQD